MFGFSTGIFFGQDKSILEIIRDIKKVEHESIELNFGKPGELLDLPGHELDLISQELKAFKEISIHAPFREINYSFGDRLSTQVLAALSSLAKSVSAKYVVFHPDTIASPALIEETLGKLAALENMDKNKKFGQTIVDLSQMFGSMPSARFLLDLNHIYTVDPSMKLVREMYEAFSSRLISYHVSGYGGEKYLHTTLDFEKSSSILDAIPDRGIIAIHEGSIDSVERLSDEYNFIKNDIASKIV